MSDESSILQALFDKISVSDLIDIIKKNPKRKYMMVELGDKIKKINSEKLADIFLSSNIVSDFVKKFLIEVLIEHEVSINKDLRTKFETVVEVPACTASSHYTVPGTGCTSGTKRC